MGTALALIGVAAALLALVLASLRRPSAGNAKRSAATARPPGAGRKAALPRHAGPFHWEGAGDFDFQVVGESHYQKALARLAGDHGEKWARAEHVATLVLDDGNASDASAVRVEIAGETVGYLSKLDARSYRRRLGQKGLSGVHATCDAVVMGGATKAGERLNYGVLLDMKPFD
jgi:hypothetical protein